MYLFATGIITIVKFKCNKKKIKQRWHLYKHFFTQGCENALPGEHLHMSIVEFKYYFKKNSGRCGISKKLFTEDC